MKFLFITVTLLLVSKQSLAQNESLLPLFDQAKNYFVPALTGDKGKTSFYAIGGYQYYTTLLNHSSSHKNRTSLNVDFSSPFYTKGRHRLSAGVFYSYQQNNNIRYSIISQNNIRGNIAYSYKSKLGTFSIGSFIDCISMKTDLSSIKSGYSKEDNFFNTSMGIAYRSKNEIFYCGASVNNIFEQVLHAKINNSNHVYYAIARDYYFNFGIDLPVSKIITLSPSVNIWYNAISIVNANVMAQYKKRYLFGLQYNSNGLNDLGGFRLGYKTGPLAIHYAYCLYLSRLGSVSSGQHSLGLVYVLGK